MMFMEDSMQLLTIVNCKKTFVINDNDVNKSWLIKDIYKIV